jgi:hypothetical protein
MTNLEYIFLFANKHNFPKSDCEIMFRAINNGKEHNVYDHDNDIISVKFDETLVENEINIEDIRFDIDSDFPEDVFFMWQKSKPEMSFRGWIALGEYVPTIIQNAEFLNEIDTLTKEIEMKLSSVFGEVGVGEDSDFEYDDDEDDEE